MKPIQDRRRTIRLISLLWLGAAACVVFPDDSATAGERKFLVVLATSPKQYGNSLPPGGLPNPQLIRNQYFDKINAGILSFAEYWEEISYGDITISGDVTDWISLPWPIQPQVSPAGFADLNDDQEYSYGAGEVFSNSRAMVIVDIDGDFGPNRVDNGPVNEFQNPPFARGAQARTAANTPAWTPGERFIDMDGDGRWDGLDEATNQMDFYVACTNDTDCWNILQDESICVDELCVNPITRAPTLGADGKPDLDGPWYDLNGDGVPNNDVGCVYLPDSDNDGNPDCCPFGTNVPSCNTFGANSCPASRWTDAIRGDIIDCNGNLIDDTLDILTGRSNDRLPVTAGDNACDQPSPDGIPDECQFEPYNEPCVDQVAPNCDPAEDPCCNTIECNPLVPTRENPPARCEYHDVNGNRQLDIVEPFENGVSMLRRSFQDPNDDEPVDDTCNNRVPDQYIEDNYPGVNPGIIIDDRNSSRVIAGSHDPFLKATGTCRCATAWPDGSTACKLYSPPQGGSITKACPAGEHAQYDPPDWWDDSGETTKMIKGTVRGVTTPAPGWWVQAWRDRYPGSAVPATWPEATVEATPVVSEGATARMEFQADRGGLSGRGVGWVGCNAAGDPNVVFATGDCGNFEQLCNRPIFPEEMNGIGSPLVLYDGPVEHDDLPSSKYHMGGDQNLGEVTSPFGNDIWGQDRGDNSPYGGGFLDGVIPAAGPYATGLHGQLGKDAGNVLQMEVLTWRTSPPFNDGTTWSAWYGEHRYASPLNPPPTAWAGSFPRGAGLGFRDYNLDGLIDRGEVVPAGSGNYLEDYTANDPAPNAPRGTGTSYPWNRRRLWEDAIEVLDDFIDFDDYADSVTLERMVGGPFILPVQDRSPVPPPDLYMYGMPNLPFPYYESEPPIVSALCSGIVLLPNDAHVPLDFLGAGSYYPVHNEDGLLDPAFPDASFPDPRTPERIERLSWNLWFNDLVIALNVEGESNTGTGGYQCAYCAHEYLHTWERFPDLYDYDIYDPPPIRENCPVGWWDIMANGGLVHPTPILKELGGTGWIRATDVTTVLTPGVDKVITLPPAEWVRDDSYFFLENEDRLGEKYYFWSAGSGFDEPRADGGLPGDGMLIMHTDFSAFPSNPDAIPPQQRIGDRPLFLIVQADGLSELDVCDNRGDGGDPWPGDSNNTRFACDTLPASQWYTQQACTGLEVSEIAPDAAGSIRATFNWMPTNIPSLRFVDPPGGVSVGGTYKLRATATDVYGGTWIRFYYTTSETATPVPNGAQFIRRIRKSTPGTSTVSADWNISGLPDGRYFLYAELIPSQGADGSERRLTTPRKGRNNRGSATIDITPADINVSTINASGVITTGTARSETWTVRCVDETAGKWTVYSSLTQPEPEQGGYPYAYATVGQTYTSLNGAVKFTLVEGATGFTKGALGDMFTFTTTGITAPSAAVAILDGKIREDPTAIIDVDKLSGLPPLEVQFDARRSRDPNGQPLTYRWDFGDGTEPSTEDTPVHTFYDARTFTVVLRATNPNTNPPRFGEASVDIEVINNPPRAIISAKPTSGQPPLSVQFSGTQSSDTETPEDRLVYQWDFGDGQAANDQGLPGTVYATPPSHTYKTRADGSACTATSPCSFMAALTVTDEGGKQDVDSIIIRVGNTNPTAVITHDALEGPTPHTVTFSAAESTDPDGDTLNVLWVWANQSGTEVDYAVYPAATGKPPATDGSVPIEFVLPEGQSVATYGVFAVVCDAGFDPTTYECLGGPAVWPGVIVTVNPPPVPSSDPHAEFTIDPEYPLLEEEVTVDASGSYDNPDQGPIASYMWDWGDGSDKGSGVIATHTYTLPGQFMITLTVSDDETPPNTTSVQRIINIAPVNHPPVALIATGLRTAPAGSALIFDGRISYDPDGDALSYRWEFSLAGVPEETLTGSQVTKVFSTQGVYTVVLTVFDGLGAFDSSEPETITITKRTVGPIDPGPGQDVPDDGGGLVDPKDSADQRPGGTGGLCGFGMMMSLFASLLGLSVMAVARRRFRL